MARPARVQVLEAYEHDDGLYLWVDVDGAEVCILVPPGAITDRKLAYGYAQLVEETSVFTEPSGRTVESVSAERPEDLSSDADDLALRAILAEHLDRFEATNYDLAASNPPLRPNDLPEFRRARHHERSHDVPARAPSPNRLAPRREPRRQA